MTSPLLYDNNAPKHPVAGMDLGCVSRKELTNWIHEWQLKMNKGMKVGKIRGNHTYSWQCTSDACPARVVVVKSDDRWSVKSVEQHGLVIYIFLFDAFDHVFCCRMCNSFSRIRQKDVSAVAIDHVTMLYGSTQGPTKKRVKSLLKDKLQLNVQENSSESRKIQRGVKRAKEESIEVIRSGANQLLVLMEGI